MFTLFLPPLLSYRHIPKLMFGDGLPWSCYWRTVFYLQIFSLCGCFITNQDFCFPLFSLLLCHHYVTQHEDFFSFLSFLFTVVEEGFNNLGFSLLYYSHKFNKGPLIPHSILFCVWSLDHVLHQVKNLLPCLSWKGAFQRLFDLAVLSS